jgi:hypothetical protein
MTDLLSAIAALYLTAAMITIATIGKPRQPVTAGTALASLAIAAVILIRGAAMLT